MHTKTTKFYLENISEIYIIAALFLFTILIRIVSLEYIEIGGDSINVWNNVVSLVKTGNLVEWTHQTMRWGITMPLYLILKLFGTETPNYYILPVVYSVISTVLVYYVAKHIGGRVFAVFTAVLLVLYPPMTTMGSQLWPGLYEMTYLLGCVLAVLTWRDKNSWYLLAIAGVLAGCAWGSRLTCIYYALGILSLLVFDKKKFQPVLIFSTFFLLVVGMEWFYFYCDTGNTLGRFGVMTQTHVTRGELLVSFSEYLLNCLKLVKFRGLLPVVIVSLFIAVWLLRKGRSLEKCISILFLGGLFFNVYMISSLSPLKLAAPVGSRYFTAAVPYMIMVLLFGINRLHKKSPHKADVFKWGLVIAFAAFTIKAIPAQNTIFRLQKDVKNAKLIAAEDLPVVMRFSAWSPNAIEKAAMSVFGYKKEGRLKINETDKMIKNARRIRVMAFGLPADEEYRPRSIDGYYYFYRGNMSTLSASTQVGLSDYNRKEHKLLIVPVESLPKEITRGNN